MPKGDSNGGTMIGSINKGNPSFGQGGGMQSSLFPSWMMNAKQFQNSPEQNWMNKLPGNQGTAGFGAGQQGSLQSSFGQQPQQTPVDWNIRNRGPALPLGMGYNFPGMQRGIGPFQPSGMSGIMQGNEPAMMGNVGSQDQQPQSAIAPGDPQALLQKYLQGNRQPVGNGMRPGNNPWGAISM